jgi:hypothetical protein
MAKKPSTGNAFDLSVTTSIFKNDNQFNGVNQAKASAQSIGIGIIEYQQKGVRAKSELDKRYHATQYKKPRGKL